jgi:hypothetical protein
MVFTRTLPVGQERPEPFRDFIEYASGHEGVWIPPRGEIARWWLERYGEAPK